jgi:hypothetical protein
MEKWIKLDMFGDGPNRERSCCVNRPVFGSPYGRLQRPTICFDARPRLLPARSYRHEGCLRSLRPHTIDVHQQSREFRGTVSSLSFPKSQGHSLACRGASASNSATFVLQRVADLRILLVPKKRSGPHCRLPVLAVERAVISLADSFSHQRMRIWLR